MCLTQNSEVCFPCVTEAQFTHTFLKCYLDRKRIDPEIGSSYTMIIGERPGQEIGLALNLRETILIATFLLDIAKSKELAHRE